MGLRGLKLGGTHKEKGCHIKITEKLEVIFSPTGVSYNLAKSHQVSVASVDYSRSSRYRVNTADSHKESSFYLARRSLRVIINSTLGMPIHRWLTQTGGTLFSTCIKLKSKQRERESGGASESPRFSQMRSEMRLCLFLQKEMKWSALFSNFESRLYLPALFSANLRKAFFSANCWQVQG